MLRNPKKNKENKLIYDYGTVYYAISLTIIIFKDQINILIII